MSRATKVVVATPTFQSAILITMGDYFKKLLKPEEIVLRSITGEPELQKEHLHQMLLQVEPTALIAMDIRPDPDTVNAYISAKVPIVLIDEEATGASTVTTDNFTGGRIAGEYLVSKERKKIAIVCGMTQVKGGYNAEQRLNGFRQALDDKKISLPAECTIEVAHYSREEGIEAMPKLLNTGVDAIFCAAGDNCALGLLSVAKERNMRIPDEIAIIGFDDLIIAQLSTPKLTTIKQPLEEMAHTAYEMAVTKRESILHEPQKAIFDPELVIRQSA